MVSAVACVGARATEPSQATAFKVLVLIARSNIRRSFLFTLMHLRALRAKLTYLFTKGKPPWQALSAPWLAVIPNKLKPLARIGHAIEARRLAGNRIDHKIHHRAHMAELDHIGTRQQP